MFLEVESTPRRGRLSGCGAGAPWAVLPVRHSGFRDAASVTGVAGSSFSRDEGVPPRPTAPGIAGSGAAGTCTASGQGQRWDEGCGRACLYLRGVGC